MRRQAFPPHRLCDTAGEDFSPSAPGRLIPPLVLTDRQRSTISVASPLSLSILQSWTRISGGLPPPPLITLSRTPILSTWTRRPGLSWGCELCRSRLQAMTAFAREAEMGRGAPWREA